MSTKESLVQTAIQTEPTLDFEQYSKKALEMAKAIHFQAEAPNKKALALELLKRVPLLAGFLRSLDGTGNAISKMALVSGNLSPAAQTAGKAFQFSALVPATIDFFRIPLIFVASKILGEQAPISLTKRARWIYSATLLGLTIASIAVPAIAPPIALATASLGFAVSIMTLAKHLYSMYQTKKELAQLKQLIPMEEQNLKNIQEEASLLHRSLHKALDQGDHQEATLIAKKIDVLQESFDKQQKLVQGLYNRQNSRELKLKKLGGMGIVDKGVGIALSGLAVAGLVLAIFFPPIGLGVVAASAALGAAYTIGRVATPFLVAGFKRLFGKGEKPAAAPLDDNENNLDSKPDVSMDLNETPKEEMSAETPLLSSEAKAELLLMGASSQQHLQKPLLEFEEIDRLDKELSQIVSNHDKHNIFTFLIQVGQHLSTLKPVPDAIESAEFLDNFKDLKEAMELLKQAKGAVLSGDLTLSPQEKKKLLDFKPLHSALSTHNIDLNKVLDSSEDRESETSGEEDREKKSDREGISDKLASVQ